MWASNAQTLARLRRCVARFLTGRWDPVLGSELRISLFPRLLLPPAARKGLSQLPKLLRQFADPLGLNVQCVRRALNGFSGHPVANARDTQIRACSRHRLARKSDSFASSLDPSLCRVLPLSIPWRPMPSSWAIPVAGSPSCSDYPASGRERRSSRRA